MKNKPTPCPTCGQNIAPRKVTMNKILVSAAIKAYEHSLRIGSNIIQMADVRLTPVEYSKFNDLVRFGLAYRPQGPRKRGEYGIPRERIYKFVANDWTVAEFYHHDPITRKNEMSSTRIFCYQVPSVQKILEIFGPTLTEYSEFNITSLLPMYHDQIFSIVE